MRTPDLTHAYLRNVLTRTKTIAAVGVSLKQVRPSYYVARYMSKRGYKVLPINPVYVGQRALGRKVLGSLSDIPIKHDPIQMVDIFRRSEEAGKVVDEALEVLLERGLETIWMQIGVADEKAKRRAEKKGVEVIMDLCPKMEHQRLWGELRLAGMNTGVISSKLM